MQSLEQVMKLATRTGDRVILWRETGPSFVILPLDEYEKMTTYSHGDLSNMSEEELINKINRDIALWKSVQENEDENFEADSLAKELSDQVGNKTVATPAPKDLPVDDDRFFIEPVE